MLKDYLSEEKILELKDSDNYIYKALELCLNLFENNTDKGGYPYIIHLMYVYKNVSSIDEKVVALLHDTMEDKGIKEEELLSIGFTKKHVNDVKVLTRIKPMDYNTYIDNLIKNGSKEALNVKLADLKNNMDMTRIKNPTVKDYERVEKRYAPAYEKILNKLKEM